jgi:hypothetical protein
MFLTSMHCLQPLKAGMRPSAARLKHADCSAAGQLLEILRLENGRRRGHLVLADVGAILRVCGCTR